MRDEGGGGSVRLLTLGKFYECSNSPMAVTTIRLWSQERWRFSVVYRIFQPKDSQQKELIFVTNSSCWDLA